MEPLTARLPNSPQPETQRFNFDDSISLASNASILWAKRLAKQLKKEKEMAELERQEEEMLEKATKVAKVTETAAVSEKSSSLSRNSSEKGLTKEEIKLKKYEA